MLYKISLFLMLVLLVGCESSRDIKPVESGKVIMVKKWPKETDQSIVSVKKDDLNTVAIKEYDPWDNYNRAFGKNIEIPPKIGTDQSLAEIGYR